MKRRGFIKSAGVAALASALAPGRNFAAGNSAGLPAPVRPVGSHENIVFPANAAAVVDVTKPPYNCDRTGRIDCTEALVRALDDILRPTLLTQKALVKEMESDPRQDYVHPLGVENRKVKGVVNAIFPIHLSPSKILYFPNGTYRVSDTICYTFDDLHNSHHNELNRQIIVRGQSESGTIIRLSDACAGFEAGADKPVFSFIRKGGSNVAMANMFEHITINTGAGNPGASGLRFFSNNTGAVRHVSVVSDDPDKAGSVGILCDHSNFSGSFFQHVSVDGFDYGVQVLPHKMYCVFEHVVVTNQKKAGFLVDETPVSIRGLKSVNGVPSLELSGSAGHVVLLDSELTFAAGTEGADGTEPEKCTAIEHRHGVLFARNVRVAGYRSAVERFGRVVLGGASIDEYSSHGVFAASTGRIKKSLNLPVEETPMIPWEQDLTQWTCVNDFGARGDGVTDSTAAIRAAIGSGKKVIYFQPGRYVIDGQIRVPATVERINFMFCDLVAGEKLQAMDGQGAFKIEGNSDTPLLIEDLFAFEEYRGRQYFIEHACTRTVVLSDLHTQIGAMYINSVSGGKVFIENVCCTDQFEPNPNCYRFTGQKVWARQLNPERANPQVINEGSQLWVLGFKTEGRGVGFHTRNHGSTEVMGGVINFGGEVTPFLINDNSRVAISCASRGMKTPAFKNFAREIRGKGEQLYETKNFPRRILFLGDAGPGEYDSYAEQYFVPLYVGYESFSPGNPT